MFNKTATFIIATLILLAFTGCSSSSSGEVRLQGAGATFPNPLYQKWFSEYNKTTSNVKIDYKSIGSGGGIKQISERTVDFGGTDAPMKDDDLKKAPGELLHIPTVLGAVVITYNLPGVTAELKLTPEAVAGIFLGTVTKWNDPAIASTNPGVTLPAENITPVQRSDGSGTTFVFTDYLSKVSAEWKDKVGAGTSVNWPAGMRAKGNEGVTGQVKQTPNTIGYVEWIYAEQNKLPVAALKNSAGGVATGAMLAIARIAGETAPLLFTALSYNYMSADIYQPIASLTYQIYYYAGSPYEQWHSMVWAATLVLVGMILAINVVVKFLTRNRYQ